MAPGLTSQSSAATALVQSPLKLQLPSASTFSFKAPFPAPPSSLTISTSVSTPSSPLKQRRVSLALSSSPRVVPAWSFRDDTEIESHIAETSCLVPEKRGKMRKIAANADEEEMALLPEKKQRKKWSPEETQMLVDGCNRVSGIIYPLWFRSRVFTNLFGGLGLAWRWELEGYPQRPQSQIRQSFPCGSQRPVRFFHISFPVGGIDR